MPTLAEERFESSIELEWPIEGLEPLSFVLTRLLEPLSTRLERRDRGAAVLHVAAPASSRGRCTRGAWSCRRRCATCGRCGRSRCSISSRIRRAAAIDRVTIVIDPTPGRVLQHTLFTRAHPTPEQLSTLLARLGALMGQDRFGAPATVDSYRPGAFAMTPFATEHDTINAELAEHRREDRSKLCDSASSAPVAETSSPAALQSCVERRQRASPLPPARCRRASRSPTAGRCASRPIAAASPAARVAAVRGPVADVGRVVGESEVG